MVPKPVSSKTLLLSLRSSPSSFPYSILISHLSTFSPTSQPHSQYEEKSRNVRVSVWWDFENCNVPAGTNVFKVAPMITAAIRSSGIKGPVQITAFGDMLQLARSNQEALSATGINLAHIPHGGKNSADRSLLVDLMYWVSQNPPPAHLFLISGDRDFASILHRLRMNNYNILLASKDGVSGVLCSAASIMWNWDALVRGETLNGRYFNQPPDGPYGSWYGHYKVPLEDPFVVELPTMSRGEQVSEGSSEPNIRSIPKSVIKQIRQILSSNPNGISVGDLYTQLMKSKVTVDKDLYGYKKFSRFLSAMPQILKMSSGDGRFVVHSSIVKGTEPYDPSPFKCTGPFINDGNKILANSSKSNAEGVSVPRSVDAPPSLSPDLNTEEIARNVEHSLRFAEKDVKVTVEEPPKDMDQPPSISEKGGEKVKTEATPVHPPSVKEHDNASELGIFKKIWRRLFSQNDSSEIKSCDMPGKPYMAGDGSENKSRSSLDGSSGDSFEKKEAEKECMKSASQCYGPAHQTFSSSITESTTLNKTAMMSESHDEKSVRPGLFDRIINWCKFWRDNPKASNLDHQPSDALNQMHCHKCDLFSEDSFWQDMESFINTEQGALTISQSRTREQMAENLQNEGPLVLRSLNESDVLVLVELLISQKKWVEERPSDSAPFKLIRPGANNTSVVESHASNGLSSIFLHTSTESLRRPPEHDANKGTQNTLHSAVSSTVANKKTSGKSRNKIIVDCQRLVREIMKEFPEGYNIGSFRKLFFERYGYHLDVEKLGYRKLASFLQIMPGVRIESTYMIPSVKAEFSHHDTAASNSRQSYTVYTSANSDSELSGASKKDDESDSPWEELGPVDSTGPGKKEMQQVLKRKAVEETQRYANTDYESSHSDDEFSDLEGEPSDVTRQAAPVKSGTNEDSSLLQILDSWYSSKDGDNGKVKSENVEGMINCSTDSSQPSDITGLGTKVDTSSGNYSRKKRPQRSYSFVADHVDDDKQDKLINGILGSLKKSGESRMQA